MPTSFKTAKKFRGGRIRSKPQAFPVFGKRALPKLRIPPNWRSSSLMLKKSVPADVFFRGNKNPYAFAINYFGDTASAVDFLRDMKKMGATKVLVTGIHDEPERIAGEKGPYADTFIAFVEKARSKNFAIAFGRSTDEFDILAETPTHDIYRLWWD